MSRERKPIKWEGTCSNCGRPARLPFVPRDESTVLCSDCHRDQQRSSAIGRHDRSPSARRSDDLPEGYLRLGYFDTEGNPRKEMLVDEARAVAEVLASASAPELAANKVAALYNRARMLKDRLNQGAEFAAVRADIYGLLTDAVDATGRRITPEVFMRFVERNVELAAKDAKSFKEGFIEHLHGVRAWFLLTRKTNNPGRR